MIKNKLKYTVVLLFLLFAGNKIFAQLDSVMAKCNTFLTDEFISDGQQYMSLITGDQTAEFSAVFYGGNTYRVIACGGDSEKDIVFSIYDKYRNLLFTNSEYDNTNYWNFQFESTIECFIEAKFASGNKSGFAIILIGLEK